MKGLVICAAGFFSLVSLGAARPSRAETAHQIIVEPFVGMGAQRFRQQTIAALLQLEQRVVPDRNVASAAASLGLVQLSDNYTNLARDLNGTLFVEGSILANGRRLLTAQVKAKNREGTVVGRASWSGPSLATMLPRIQRGLPTGLKAILERYPNNEATGQAAAVAAVPESDSGSDPTAVAAAPPTAVEEPMPVSRRSGTPDMEAPPALLAAAEEERLRRPTVNNIDLSIGTQVYSRIFAYSQNRVGTQQDYRIVGVPAANISLDYFPLSFLGVSASGEYSFPLASRDPDGRPYRTGSFSYAVGGKGRLTFGGVEVLANAAFGSHSFSIAKDSNGGPNRPQVADVSYQQLKGGLATRIPFGRTFAFVGGANYLHLLGVGELQTAYFPYITGSGGEGFLGMAMRIMSKLEVRATANLRAYVFTMNTQPGDAREAAGAVDQYLGLNLALALRD